MKTLVITNQKGGVGKTTLTVHLAHYAMERGVRVLVIDLDTQGHTSYSLDEFDSGLKASQLFEPGAKLDALTQLHGVGGIFMVSAAQDKALSDMPRAPVMVADAFRKNIATVGQHFDLCLIDTSPAKDLVQVSALMASNFVLSPVDMETYSILGLQRLLETVFGVRAKHNPNLQFLGMLPSKLNTHSPAQKQSLIRLTKEYPQFMVKGAAIIQRTSIGEASAARKPVWKLNKTSAREAGKEFKAVLALIEEKMGGFTNG